MNVFSRDPFLGRRPAVGLWPRTARPARRTADGRQAFAYGGSALAAGLQALDLKSGAAVLVPDFICDIVPATLESLGYSPLYYPLSDDLSPSLPALEELGEQASALLVVHFFGQPQDMPGLVAFARAQGLAVIEDNAHGYGASLDGKPLGSFGDVGICSPWKQLGIPHGALLTLAEGLAAPPPPASAPPPACARQKLKAQALAALRKIFPGIDRLRALPDYANPQLEPSTARENLACDALVLDALMALDAERMAARRREVYALWDAFARASGLTPVFDALAPTACPLCYPAYAATPKQAGQWYAFGHANGVDIFSWPTLPSAIIKQKGPALERFRRLVCLPIHQDMDTLRLRGRLAKLSGLTPGNT